jgi:DNA-directed RNA polymerase specialized sigma24 family protein
MSIAPMTTDEVLAVARLRQWAVDRLKLAAAKTVDYTRSGWRERSNRDADARLVRVIDFGRALARLDPEQQLVLVLHYRDREKESRIAVALGCSLRKISYLIPAARQRLAAELDRLNLL